MNIQEVAGALAKVKLGDNREVNELIVLEWNETIGHLDYHDTIAAVTMHRRESMDYLMPAHLVRNVARIRETRAVTSPFVECQVSGHHGYPVPCAKCEREVGA